MGQPSYGFHWPEGSQHSLSLLPGAGSHPVGPLLSMPSLSLPAFVRLLRRGRGALAWPTRIREQEVLPVPLNSCLVAS